MLSVSEHDLTSYLQHNLQGAPVDAVTLWIEPQGVCVQASARDGDLVLCALLELCVVDETPQLTVPSATLNGRRLPRWLSASLAKAANDVVVDMQRAWRVERIELAQGRARVYGVID